MVECVRGKGNENEKPKRGVIVLLIVGGLGVWNELIPPMMLTYHSGTKVQHPPICKP